MNVFSFLPVQETDRDGKGLKVRFYDEFNRVKRDIGDDSRNGSGD